MEGSNAEDLRHAVKWLAIATVGLYIMLVVAGIYVYGFSRQADQIKQNTNRLNSGIAAACEVGIAPDAQEPDVVHELATGQLVIHSRDCEVILRKLREDEP